MGQDAEYHPPIDAIDDGDLGHYSNTDLQHSDCLDKPPLPKVSATTARRILLLRSSPPNDGLLFRIAGSAIDTDFIPVISKRRRTRKELPQLPPLSAVHSFQLGGSISFSQ